MRPVRVAVEEGDDEGLGPAVQQLPNRRLYRRLVERLMDLPERIHALAHLETTLARHQGLEGTVQAVGLRPIASPKLDHVPKPLGGDHSARSAFLLQRRVGTNRGAVDQPVNIGQCNVHRLQRVQKSEGLILGGGRNLGDLHDAGRWFDGNGVGKRPPDIDSDM